ncbi:hypothetical protein PFICI_00143 [Pestalotiopsis fici W106-1]|uniref:Glutamate decarboxylase n=1 Tax=Pestalotiopsis fici (strain W106-1 / CGMCC3.15140) TaxID=1229662 RepID=W3XJY9_PESFW|nr:uncharacterized protein PFICI_00143 [Pestalotiopsis fici W106-1]ETS86315.1 hypothetical protein PFICI_00143 [Pestalotiopsis fici W106-1]
MSNKQFPEDEIPSDMAYRTIKDNLVDDGAPTLNLGSFVTTYMEDEAKKLIIDSLSKNLANHEAYPVTTDLQNRCLDMIAQLFNVPTNGEPDVTAVGTSTVGSSEAILLATLAMKKRWINRQRSAGKDVSRPNLIMSSAVQVCWKKAMLYFDVEPKYIYCTKERWTMDAIEAVELVDENTIGICAILGTTYTGEYEDIKAINDLLAERDLDVPIHVDAASGGFVAPFIEPDLLWDFRLEKVASINVSGHKYGLVYAGIGWIIWRGREYLPKELTFNINYLGTEQSSLTLNFSRGASPIVSQYYNFIRLGRQGYRRVMLNLLRTTEYLATKLKDLDCFIIMSKRHGRGLPLIALRLDPAKSYAFDEFTIYHELRQQGGWIVPAYTMAPHAEDLKMLRIVIREEFSYALCDALVADFRAVLGRLCKSKFTPLAQKEIHAIDTAVIIV